MAKNRGEWSEFYVILYLLDNPNLNLVNSDLNPICDNLFVVEKLSVNEKDKIIDYLLSTNEEIKIFFDNVFKNIILKDEVKSNINIIKEHIKTVNKGAGAFEIKEIEPLLKKMTGQKFLKSNSNLKYDLIATVLDKKISQKLVLKYSVKSSFGKPATILNASNLTDFIFEVKGLTKKDIKEINKITTSKSKSKLRDGLKKIYDLGGKIDFFDIKSESFKYNLQMIDSKMPEYLGNVLLNFYQNSKSGLKDLFLENNFFKDEDFALKKLSDFLGGISFGFFPKEKWNGINEVNGGLMIVKNDGKVVVLDLIYFKQEVLKYLMEETKLDSPSSTRYKMLQLYENDGKVFFTLNLQVRYKK